MKLLNSKRVDVCLSSCPSATSQPCEEWSCAEGSDLKRASCSRRVSRGCVWLTGADVSERSSKMPKGSLKKWQTLLTPKERLFTTCDGQREVFPSLSSSSQNLQNDWPFVKFSDLSPGLELAGAKTCFYLFIWSDAIRNSRCTVYSKKENPQDLQLCQALYEGISR